MDEGNQPFRIGKDIVAERQYDAFRPGLHLFNVGTATERLDCYHLQHMLDLLRQLSETIPSLRTDSIDLPLVVDVGQTPVKR